MSRQQVPNYELATDAARANLLTNGGFGIYQRGAGPYTADLQYTADAWQIRGSTSTVSVTLIASTIGTAGISLRMAYTHSAGGTWDVRQTFKPGEQSQLFGKTLSFSVRVKSTVIGTIRPMFWDSVIGYTYGAFNATTAEELLTVTATITPAATNFIVGVVMTVASATVEVNDAMLVVGSVPADYAPLHPADDLARCLRYYEILGTGSDLIVSGIATAASQGAYAAYPHRAIKPVNPTVTLGTWSPANAGAVSVSSSTTSVLRVTVLSVTAGPFYSQSTGVVTLEANP